MNIKIVYGDLLNQPVDAIVNPWNQNIIPSWLLIPHGVSGEIKKRGGVGVFRELEKQGFIPLGKATYTSAGKLPFKVIIHIACISLFWRTSETIIKGSTMSAMVLAEDLGISSLAFPIIGSGSAGFNVQHAEDIMLNAFDSLKSNLTISLVHYNPIAP